MKTKHNVGHPLSSTSPTACIISTKTKTPKRKNQSITRPHLNFLLLFITTTITSFCSPFLKALSMDWYSWLSKSGLEPSLVYDYSLLFTHNELEEEDTVHFNHEFLLSMGISIAKHRLEILKLAKKLQRRRPPRPVAGLLSAVSKAKKCLASYFDTLAPGRDRSAIVVVPKPAGAGAGGGTGRWKGTILKRNRSLVRLMITDGGVKVRKPPGPGSVSHSASPVVDGGAGGGGDGFWGSGEEEIRWDSMFQNLKPT